MAATKLPNMVPGTPTNAIQAYVLNPYGITLICQHVPPVVTGLAGGNAVPGQATGNLISIGPNGTTPGSNGVVLSQQNALDLGTILTNFGNNGFLS